jgi:hypothetical protein
MHARRERTLLRVTFPRDAPPWPSTFKYFEQAAGPRFSSNTAIDTVGLPPHVALGRAADRPASREGRPIHIKIKNATDLDRLNNRQNCLFIHHRILRSFAQNSPKYEDYARSAQSLIGESSSIFQ